MFKIWAEVGKEGNKKNLQRRKCFGRAIFQNAEVKVEGGFAASTLTLFVTWLLIHCGTCQGLSYTKNEYNLFYHKLDAEYLFIQQVFRKKQYFLRTP